jgi:methyl-accepting chemotaxis protein
MIGLVRRLRLRTRLLGAFGTVCALLAVVTWIGIYQAGQQQRVTRQVGMLQLLTRDVMELKFRDADVSGWQVAYAWDVPFLGGRAATADDSANRKGFLDSAAALDREIGAVHAGDLTPAEATLFDQIRRNFAAFLDADKQVVELFRQESPQTTKQANAIIVGPGYDAYYKVLDATNKLIDSVKTRSDTAQRQAQQLNGRSRTLMLAGLLLALVVGVALALVITASVVRPVRRVAAGLRTLADRDLSAELADGAGDELAEMAAAFNAATGAVRGALAGVNDRAATLTAASTELFALSERMDGQARSTSSQAKLASGAAGAVSDKVTTVASAAEEMTSSIEEIARSTTAAVTVVGDAVSSADATSSAVAELGVASAEIGQIIKAITSIAEQTNLLALNATIEAARAGDAGKGFAVVASEVKDLAQETARASEDIVSKIDSIQVTTQRATEAIGQISGVVRQISQIQDTIAAAVQEQSATTGEINRNVSELATGSQQIADNIAGVAEVAAGTSADAGTTQQAAASLAGMANQLRELVGSFRY